MGKDSAACSWVGFFFTVGCLAYSFRLLWTVSDALGHGVFCKALISNISRSESLFHDVSVHLEFLEVGESPCEEAPPRFLRLDRRLNLLLAAKS